MGAGEAGDRDRAAVGKPGDRGSAEAGGQAPGPSGESPCGSPLEPQEPEMGRTRRRGGQVIVVLHLEAIVLRLLAGALGRLVGREVRYPGAVGPPGELPDAPRNTA